ncbi:hypothetical protein, partial [Actinomadura sp. 6K520]|uniref:hypothetical protein n=1 Tax=Actinomadura sp. 6K520 TaxID=2530364 RepID=UPI001A9DC16E
PEPDPLDPTPDPLQPDAREQGAPRPSVSREAAAGTARQPRTSRDTFADQPLPGHVVTHRPR